MCKSIELRSFFRNVASITIVNCLGKDGGSLELKLHTPNCGLQKDGRLIHNSFMTGIQGQRLFILASYLFTNLGLSFWRTFFLIMSGSLSSTLLERRYNNIGNEYALPAGWHWDSHRHVTVFLFLLQETFTPISSHAVKYF